MPDESAIDIGKAVEGTGKGLEHAMNGAGTFAERIHGLTRDCLLPHKAKKQVEAARAKANGAISILEETGA